VGLCVPNFGICTAEAVSCQYHQIVKYCDVLHHAEIVFPPCRAEESRKKPKKSEVSRANKREECLYFVASQRLATHVTRLAQQ
jgi:hypothetical protein